MLSKKDLEMIQTGDECTFCKCKDCEGATSRFNCVNDSCSRCYEKKEASPRTACTRYNEIREERFAEKQKRIKKSK